MLTPLLVALPMLLVNNRPMLRPSLPHRVPAAISGAATAPAFTSNHDALAAAPQFPHTWVPLASTYELDPDRPTPVSFLGQRYVAYRNNDGEWVVMDDACPHRLAPLSEGRVDRETDRIECAYHGWSFDSSGQCARIPQATDAAAAASLQSPRACVASYPTRVEKSVLFAWLWPEDLLTVVADPAAQPEAMLAGVDPDTSTYTRDLPYGWDTLLEVPHACAAPARTHARTHALSSAWNAPTLPVSRKRAPCGRISSIRRTFRLPTTGFRANGPTPSRLT